LVKELEIQRDSCKEEDWIRLVVNGGWKPNYLWVVHQLAFFISELVKELEIQRDSCKEEDWIRLVVNGGWKPNYLWVVHQLAFFISGTELQFLKDHKQCL
jgi:hypothetical protein